MKRIKSIAGGMIVCGLIAMVVGLSFFFSSSVSTKPERGKEKYIAEGKLYAEDGDYMLAVVSYQKALELDDIDTEALLGMADAYSALEYYEEEESIRTQLSDAMPDNLENWIGLIMAKLSLNKADEAKKLAEDLRVQYEDDDLEALYHQMDIKEPVFNIVPGSYDSYQLLTLDEIPDNATIYYTVDGTEPTKLSKVYSDGIILSYPDNVVKAKAFGLMGNESKVVELKYEITVPVESVDDIEFEWIIRDELNKNWDDPIYNYELAQFRSFFILGDYDHSIEKLSDITFYADGYTRYQSKNTELGTNEINVLSYMPFLKTLSIGYQEFVDLSCISDLIYLEELSLLHDNITEVQELSKLKNLRILALGWNQISDVSPLAGLDNLESLGLWDNQIVDVRCLQNLSNLSYFDITGNQVRDISCIKSMPHLSELWIARNQIGDMTPLDTCENLSILMMADNPASDYRIGEKKTDSLLKTDL